MTHRDRFEAIYDAYYLAIHQYAARRTGSPDDTTDVISETFLTAWRRIGDVPEREEALLWLYGVARRVLANQQRGASRRAVLAERLRGELAADRPVGPVGPDHVRAAFDELPERDREVLALACWEGRLTRLRGKRRLHWSAMPLTLEEIEALPADPEALKRRAVEAITVDEDFVGSVEHGLPNTPATLLYELPASPQVRAAAYQALATLPLVRVEGPTTGPRGRPGGGGGGGGGGPPPPQGGTPPQR
uniref:RNA polymerase sigma factor n=1 Tax=Streptosporangium sp. V21-05 TaxID=3446115 RepID=UPI003F53E2EE